MYTWTLPCHFPSITCDVHLFDFMYLLTRLLTYYRCLPEINVYRPNMQQLYPKNQQFVLLFQARMTSILFYPTSIWRIFDQASKLIIDKHERFFRSSGSRNFCINCFLVVTEFAWKLLDLDYGAYVVCIHMPTMRHKMPQCTIIH